MPHIRAEDSAALARAFGWAQMAAHAETLLRSIGEARGRAAEYWGAEFLESDRWVHRMDIPRRAALWFEEQTPAGRARLESFATGVNLWAEHNRRELAGEFAQVLPVTGADLLARAQHLLHFTFVADENAVGAATAAVPAGGSNAWAVGPEQTVDGRSLLLANPHLPWQGRFRLFEAHLECPDYRAYGATFVGFPVLATGFNRDLAWTHTVNAQDGADLFRVELEGDRYPFGEALREIERESVTLRDSTEGAPVELPLARTIHGPIVAEEDGAVLALRVVGLDRPHLFDQWWSMGAAGDLEAFERALAQQALPLFSTLYADVDGHILYHFGGLTPVRARADLDWGRPVDGNDPATLWSEYHRYEELPRILDPATGWVQNANDPPWTATHPPALDPDDYPPYMSARGLSLRAQGSIALLTEGLPLSLESLADRKHSTAVVLAERTLDSLLEAAASEPGLEEATATLERWDRRTDAASRGALLFLLWVQALGDGAQVFAEDWLESEPLETPRGLADPARAVAALHAAVARARSVDQPLDAPWGTAFRLRSGANEVPASGGMGALGIFRTFEFSSDPDGALRAVGGDSFVAAVELTRPPRARVLNTYGNASRPGSEHDGDQLHLAAAQELREAWVDWAAVEAHAALREWVPEGASQNPGNTFRK